MSSTATASPNAMPATPANVTTVAVIGSGQMGAGIAQVFATQGRNVWMVDTAPDALERATSGIAASVAKLHAKGRLTDEQAAAADANISTVTNIGELPADDIDLVVEAATEHVATKLAIFTELDGHLDEQAILASNTSSIPITRLAGATGRPDRVVGMHFMNPVPILELVEVIPGLATSDAVTELIEALATDIGKTPVRSSDSPGFITNRILMPMINEAMFCLHEGVGTAEGIDTAMKLGMAHPMGPLALADLIGLDTCLSIMEVLHRELGDDKYRPCPLLRTYVDAGRLGRKSGAGIYDYS